MPRQISLRERALALLARREHSRAELRRKLAPHCEQPEELDSLLEDLVRARQLSDERFAEARIHTLSRKYGAVRIEQDLRARGLDKEQAAAYAREARITDLERCREVWRRKFGRIPKDAAERGKQARFLLARGFSTDIVSRVLKSSDE